MNGNLYISVRSVSALIFKKIRNGKYYCLSDLTWNDLRVNSDKDATTENQCTGT